MHFNYLPKHICLIIRITSGLVTGHHVYCICSVGKIISERSIELLFKQHFRCCSVCVNVVSTRNIMLPVTSVSEEKEEYMRCAKTTTAYW